ncbi:MAG TPA: PEGA domain-containing protein [Kofleriaceae bacterium]|jgi:tetratricopeptide (TPR) repeat protein|nr:PEGA domain-containing protein [Kofleriaceae bacterium]
MMRVLVMLVFLGGVAHAGAPWEENVSKPQQDAANKLFADGNALFARQAHVDALAKYRAALAIWDHPLIRFNLAVTLIRLDRILEAAEHLDRALRFGAAPFSDELYRQALDYQRLVAGRVAVLIAHCATSGARITLDGKQWFGCPDTKSLRVLAGEHQLTAERDGFQTLSRRLMLDGGKVTNTDVELSPDRDRWYQHWYVLGIAGALAVAAGGTAIYFATRDNSGVDVRGMTN